MHYGVRAFTLDELHTTCVSQLLRCQGYPATVSTQSKHREIGGGGAFSLDFVLATKLYTISDVERMGNYAKE